MSETANPIDQTRLALAVLAACIAQAADAPEGERRSAFLANLERAYANLREGPLYHYGAAETLVWARDALYGLQPR